MLDKVKVLLVFLFPYFILCKIAPITYSINVFDDLFFVEHSPVKEQITDAERTNYSSVSLRCHGDVTAMSRRCHGDVTATTE